MPERTLRFFSNIARAGTFPMLTVGRIENGVNPFVFQRRQKIFLIALAVAYSLADREEEAHATATQILRIEPKFSVEYYSKTLRYKNQAHKELFVDALSNAGLE